MKYLCTYNCVLLATDWNMTVWGQGLVCLPSGQKDFQFSGITGMRVLAQLSVNRQSPGLFENAIVSGAL